MVRAEHFKGFSTKLDGGSLSFDEVIHPGDREAACLAIGSTFDETARLLEELADLRAPARVVVHPSKPSAAGLLRKLKRHQGDLPDEMIDVGYGLSESYSRAWEREVGPADDIEGQHVVAVIFDQRAAVGYCGLSISLIHDREERSLYIRFEPQLVYVSPRHRKLGFGLDLSVACGLMCGDVLEAAYRAVPARTLIDGTVFADYESAGGEAFTQHLHACMEVTFDRLREWGGRRSIQLGRAELDAGY